MNKDFDGKAIVREVIPDLDQRVSTYTVTTEDVDEELRRLFLEQLGRNLHDLQSAMSPPLPSKIRGVAHSLKGVGGTMGAPEVSVLAEELEAAAQTDALRRCGALIDALRRWEAEFRSANNF